MSSKIDFRDFRSLYIYYIPSRCNDYFMGWTTFDNVTRSQIPKFSSKSKSTTSKIYECQLVCYFPSPLSVHNIYMYLYVRTYFKRRHLILLDLIWQLWFLPYCIFYTPIVNLPPRLFSFRSRSISLSLSIFLSLLSFVLSSLLFTQTRPNIVEASTLVKSQSITLSRSTPVNLLM